MVAKNKPMVWGYARVSTTAQSLAEQSDALTRAGAAQIVAEKFTGTTTDRPELQRLLDRIEPEDELIVTKLDRLARNTKEALTLLDELQEKRVHVRVLNLGDFILTEEGKLSPAGKLMRTMLLAFAEMERDMIVERTAAGKEFARLHNPNFREGRKPALTPSRQRAALDYLKDHTQAQTAEFMGVSKSTIARLLRSKRDSVRQGLD